LSARDFRGAVGALTAFCIFIIATGTEVHAQGAPEADVAGGKRVAEILVTGSRIKRADSDTLEPSIILTGDDVRGRGLTNVADALNETPGFGAGVTPEGGQSSYAPGVNFVNLFGLGTNRTLTLVNGRRIVTSNPPALFGPAAPGDQVDLNFIPTILLDKIETLTIGGAPTYGADAIAGVVNVKLKKDFTGIQAFGQYGQLDSGGGRSNSAGLVGGWNFAGERGNVTASIQRSTSDGVLALSNRRFANAYNFSGNPNAAAIAGQTGRTPANDGRVNPAIPFNTSSADGIPGSVLIRNRRSVNHNFNGVVLPLGADKLPDGRLRCFGAGSDTCLQFAPDGNLVPYDRGINFGTSDASGGDGLFLMSTLQLMTELERTTGTVSAHFDVTDHVQLFADVFAYHNEADELTDQPVFNTISFAGTSSGPITLPAMHPMLTQQARDTLAGLGVSTFRLSRASRDLAVNNASGSGNLYQAVAGATGGFDAANRHFEWETYFNFGQNRSRYTGTQLDHQRFVNALNVVSVGGQLKCSPSPGYTGLPDAQGRILVNGEAPVADPDCVPLDIFGDGRPSAAALAYVASVQQVTAELEQQVFNANIGSTLFATRGGPVQYNVGFEHRRESGAFLPDAYLSAGLGRSAAIARIRGDYSTNELFGEVSVPLFSNENALPGLERLTLIAKARRVDASMNGSFTAWTGGLEWAPVEDFQLRGNATRSLRVPGITELYLPVSPLFGQVNDPCSSGFLTAGTRQATRRANCERFFAEYGLPDDGSWISNATTAAVPGTSQGDPNLGNETSNAWTAGFLLRPRWVPELTLAVDWVDVRVDNAITRLSGADLSSACFDNTHYPNHYCDYFTRSAPGSGQPGQITFYQSGYANGAFQSMAGMILEGNLAHEFGRFGALDVALKYYRLSEELRSATGLATTNSQGQIGSPTDTAQITLGWRRGNLGVRWQGNYVSSQLYDRTFSIESRDILEVNADWVHNLSLSYQPTQNVMIRLAVTNVFDGAPPFPISVDAFNGNYDFLGRRYSLSVAYDFGVP
jgi:outer membrane receptor protein involved in Fe transport